MFDREQEGVEVYEPVVRKLAAQLRSLEVETGFVEMRNVRVIQMLIDRVLADLNASARCTYVLSACAEGRGVGLAAGACGFRRHRR